SHPVAPRRSRPAYAYSSAPSSDCFSFFNARPSSVSHTLSLHDALPISGKQLRVFEGHTDTVHALAFSPDGKRLVTAGHDRRLPSDRKSTRLNSSHVESSYAVFCLKKKTS